MAQPTTDLLDRVLISKERGAPLHLQVRGILRDIIEHQCEDGQPFWTETVLMQKLGVSRATVRKALSDLTREGLLVRRAALGTTVSKKTIANTLGVFVHQYNSDYQSELLQACADECRRRGFQMQPYYTHNGDQVSEAFERVKLPPHQQRIIIMGETEGFTSQLYKALQDRGYRAVVVDAIFPGFRGAYVGTDNEQVVRLGVDHLRSLGHKRITLFVNEPAAVESVQVKIRTFERICREEGLDESRVFLCGTKLGESSFDAAYQSMDRVWMQEPRPTALFTLSDPGAWAALKWCAGRRIEVPAQLSVLGFEGVRPSRFTNPSLTSVAHPIVDLAKRAIDLLWEKDEKQELLPPHLVMGDSTGPAPSP
ncbi:purine operon repressor [Capsulimonas corticalis]|uniref:Purine operon repressor n=1 Tax=Capsulimonas corticalis TaxID=2219043 RepID=A0A402D2P2_9BACT|nr:substrate-binding domain-containing protein [Capsulimonas corticalis]BDI28442.1 purine operon repressor [Capsulimonas corticalis]